MKLQIDNFDGTGAHDYTSAIESTGLPRIIRRLNHGSQMHVTLVADSPSFLVPADGARVTLKRNDDQDIFTGYLIAAPTYEYLGWGQTGPVYRYQLKAASDEIILDRKRLPSRASFVARSAGDAIKELSRELLPGVFDTSSVEDLDALPSYTPTPQKKWSEHAAEIAALAGASYRAQSGALVFAPTGTASYPLNESDTAFSPDSLKLAPGSGLINDITVIGHSEPQAYVKDYFVGDGVTLRFYLSQAPFTRSTRTILDEEYKGSGLDPNNWTLTDSGSVISVNGGKLQVAGGNGVDGHTFVQFGEQVELGGACILQHGDITFSGASDGVLGGLYVTSVSVANCIAGFRITPSGASSQIQALVNGGLTGPVMATVSTHHYVFTTRFYALEIYRKQQVFHSSARPAGNPRGGSDVSANVRVVLEVHDIDPADPVTATQPSTVLFDGVITAAPSYCLYALVNSSSLHCAIAFTRILQAIDTEVRSALPSSSYRTRLVGSLSDGAECQVSASGPTLQFYTPYPPAPNELIEVHYRGHGLALARLIDSASIAAHANGSDDGVRAAVLDVKSPAPRTSVDCENAALAILDDASGSAWSGEYQSWSDYLPQSAEDVFPGDALPVTVPTRAATFDGIIREVEVQIKDLDQDHSLYKIAFAEESAQRLGFEFQSSRISNLSNIVIVPVDKVGTTYIADLTAASITGVTSTTVTVDAGTIPPPGGGIEIRRSDFGWGPDNDRNLVGRFTSQATTLPRLSRVQDYYLRQFDASTPPRYSRYTAALHLDYPL
jgi:hypothetical protein